MSSAASQAKSQANRAADSKPLEYFARGGFVAYGVIHLLFAWLALQIAFGNSGKESDQSGALTELASKPFGEVLVIIVIVGMVALAVWQAFLAVLGEKDEQGKAQVTDRVVSGIRAIIYLTIAWSGFKIVKGAGSSNADSQEKGASTLMDHAGGRWLLGVIGLIVIGVGIGLAVYGLRKKFEDHQNVQQMSATVHKTVRRLAMFGYSAKGVAYVIAGVLVIIAAVTYDPDKARGLDAALRTLAQASYGPWLLGLIALGIAAFGVFCFAQAKYRKV